MKVHNIERIKKMARMNLEQVSMAILVEMQRGNELKKLEILLAARSAEARGEISFAAVSDELNKI